MEIRQLISFTKIVQFESFSKAAAALGYSQSALTVQIQQLEKELESLNAEKQEIEAKLSGEVSEIEEITKLSKRLEEILALTEEKEMRWLELEEIKESDL